MLRLPIIVVAHQRAESLRRLLGSLERAHYPGKTDLILSIDGSTSREVHEIAQRFIWKAGEKTILCHDPPMGLKAHILACGDLSKNYDGVIILEDDLFVAKDFYDFAVQSFEFYRDQPDIAGISLYSVRYNESAQFPFIPVADQSDVFFAQYSSSWGQIWSAAQWKLFREWYDLHRMEDLKDDLSIPGDVRKWPATSWKKYHIRYLAASNRFYVYPRNSLVTNFCEVGAHYKINENYLQVPLVLKSASYRFVPVGGSLAVYDAFFELLPSCLNKMTPQLRDYDYTVDLYGIKSLFNRTGKYILTTKRTRSSLFTYGRKLKPHELNVAEQIPGDTIRFAKVEDAVELGNLESVLHYHRKEQLLYFYDLRHYHFGRNRWMMLDPRTPLSYVYFFFNKMVMRIRRLTGSLRTHHK